MRKPMNTQMPESRQKGTLLREGKTKKIYGDLMDPTAVIVEAKVDITAGDGAKHDRIPGKAELATRTTCNVFALLNSAGIPTAYNERVDETSYSAMRSIMVELEVVVRREAHGSFCVRYPHVKKGTIFPRLVFELFLKTSGKKWKDKDLLCDDPLAVYVPHENTFHLYDVKKPFGGQEPFLIVPASEVFKTDEVVAALEHIEEVARKAFLVLEKQWQLLGHSLVDFKIEVDTEGRISDSIDNDSWRLVNAEGAYEDKQVYRDGGELNKVEAAYRRVADMTDCFGLPTQNIIIWTGSEKDNITAIAVALETLSEGCAGDMPSRNPNVPRVTVGRIVCSMHKEPERGMRLLRNFEQESPLSVVIAVIGKSNGAGPTLSAHTTMPVITVSPTVKDFPNDVWSSLRGPSEVPLMTVLDEVNAAHAALNVLALHNPALYAPLRYKMEQRFVNTIDL